MGNVQGIEIEPAAALEFFKGANISVQEVRAVKVKGDDGKARDAYQTRAANLAARHILAAKDYGTKAVIVTIDGKRHEVEKK